MSAVRAIARRFRAWLNRPCPDCGHPEGLLHACITVKTS